MSEPSNTLRPEDTFHFSCHSGIECFTKCCQDVNILLTPYDIVMMKNRLLLSRSEMHVLRKSSNYGFLLV